MAAAVLVATQAPAAAQASAKTELMNTPAPVDRKVADVTFQTVVMPARRRRARLSKEEKAELARLETQQVQYARLEAASPQELMALAEQVRREYRSNSYDIISYGITPRSFTAARD